MLNIEKLIQEVHKRRCLWDQSHPQHRKRELKPVLWKEIAKICGGTPDAVQSKWKNLRDSFRSEYKKNGTIRYNNTPYVSSWAWFNSLMFLEGTTRKHNVENIVKTTMKTECDESQYEISYNAVLYEDTSQEKDNTTFEAEEHKVHNGTISPQPLIETVICDIEKRSLPSVNNLEVPEKRIKMAEPNVSTNRIPDNDDTYHFLMSLHKPLSALPVDRQMFVRFKVQELIFNEMSRSTNS